MRALVIAVTLLTLTLTATAQDSSEFGRTDGGQIEAITKQSKKLSGSLGATLSDSAAAFGSGLKGYDATLGGTLIDDRLWFFASTHHRESATFASDLGPIFDPATMSTSSARLDMNLSARHNLGASYSSGGESILNGANMPVGVVPSSFLSLRYMGMISPNAFFNATFTRRQTDASDPLRTFDAQR